MMTKVLLLALCGALGTLLRVGLSSLVLARFGSDFPWGTLIANLVGSAVFGVVWAATGGASPDPSPWRFYVLAGLLGAFTTFSSLMFDVANLLSAGRTSAALLNLVGQNALGLGAMALGILVGQKL